MFLHEQVTIFHFPLNIFLPSKCPFKMLKVNVQWQACLFMVKQWIQGMGELHKMFFTELTLATETCGMGSYLF